MPFPGAELWFSGRAVTAEKLGVLLDLRRTCTGFRTSISLLAFRCRSCQPDATWAVHIPNIPYVGVRQVRLIQIFQLLMGQNRIPKSQSAYGSLTKKPKHPMTRIERSIFRKSLRSSGVFRWVSESHMNERN